MTELIINCDVINNNTINLITADTEGIRIDNK